jgi:O-antigen/teichoic acid export membrane protein
MNIRRLATQSIVYGLGQFAQSIAAFLLLPVYTRFLSVSDYGILALMGIVSPILGAALGMGLSSALFKDYHRSSDDEERRRLVGTALTILALVTIPPCALLILWARQVATFVFHEPGWVLYLRWTVLTVALSTLATVPMSVLRAQERSILFTQLSLLQLTVSVGLAVYGVVALGKGVLGVLTANAAGAGVLLVASLLVIVRDCRPSLSKGPLKSLLSFGMPAVPNSLATWVLTFSDRYLLSRMATLDQVGLYSVGYRFGQLINALLVGPFRTAWLPYAFSMEKRPEARATFSRVVTYNLLVFVGAGLAISCLGHDLVRLMAASPFHQAYRVIPWIVLAYVCYGMYRTIDIGILVTEQNRFRACVGPFGALINLGLNFWLIPRHGMMGAAWATTVAYGGMMLLVFFQVKRTYTIPYEVGRIVRIIGVAGALYLLSSVSGIEALWPSLFYRAVLVACYPLLLWIVGFWTPEERKAMGRLLGRAGR